MGIGLLAARLQLGQFCGLAAPTTSQFWGLALVVLAGGAFLAAWHLMNRKWRTEPR
jgi:hypothetical protein